jgi:hypothetical protein
MHTEFEWCNFLVSDHQERGTMTIQINVEQTDHRNWIWIMAGGGFNTVGVKSSDFATAVFCRHLFKPEV